MLSSEGIFRKVPYVLDEVQKRFVVALRYAYDIIELNYGHLLRTLANVALVNGQVPSVDHVAVFANAWSLVDNLNRARQLLSTFPAVKDLSCSIQFVSDTDEIRLLRNRLQHLQEDLLDDKKFKIGYPIYGNITWFHHAEGNKLVAGSISAGPDHRAGGTPASIVVPPTWERPLGNVCLNAFERSIQISRFVSLLRSVMPVIDRVLTDDFREFAQRTSVERGLPLERVTQPAVEGLTLLITGEILPDGQLSLVTGQPG